ncbi:MAG: tRNA uracil 4-sulfurtransferase ThiI [Patescibacteria group bacterium]
MEKRKVIVAHYHEIALKGKNRALFERALVSNMEAMLAGTKISRASGRILIENFGDEKITAEILRRVFGIKYFVFAVKTDADMEAIKTTALDILKKPYPASFRITASRSEKTYAFTSADLMKEVGAYVGEKTGMKVDLKRPDAAVFIEVAASAAFLYREKISGAGGLPVGVAGKVVSLLSSGFDSPVAVLRMMKRGCEPVLLHFHSYPYTARDSMENAEKLAGVIFHYSPRPIKLYLVPFLGLQEHIVKSAPSALLTIMYRRWMLKIAEEIARREKALALVTGDSVSQVASQTLENILTVSEATVLPILRPLAGFDKEEIIAEAVRYGTYDISSRPYGDCCGLFTTGSPATRSRLIDVKKVESRMSEELNILADKALSSAEIKEIK